MRWILSLIVTVTLIAPSNAQSDTSKVVKRLMSIKPKRPVVEVNFAYGLENDDIRTSHIFNFISDDFLDNSEKDDLFSDVSNQLRFGFERTVEVNYIQPSYRSLGAFVKGFSLSIRNTFLSSASINNTLAELVLYGNRRFAGETIDIGPGKFETWYYTNLEYKFDIKIDSLPANIGVGLVLGHDHQLYDINRGQLFTEDLGQYIETDLDYSFRDASIADFNFLEGMGLSFSGSTTFRIKHRYKLDIGFQDLGFITWIDGRKLDVDTAFQFQGINYPNIFDINDSLVTRQRDSYEQRLYFNETGGYTTLLPFKVSTKLRYLIRNRKFPEAFVSADYRYIAGYVPRFGAGIKWVPKSSQSLTMALAYGGFNAFSVEARYQLEFWDKWRLALGITNLPGLVPNFGTGTTLSAGLGFEL